MAKVSEQTIKKSFDICADAERLQFELFEKLHKTYCHLKKKSSSVYAHS